MVAGPAPTCRTAPPGRPRLPGRGHRGNAPERKTGQAKTSPVHFSGTLLRREQFVRGGVKAPLGAVGPGGKPHVSVAGRRSRMTALPRRSGAPSFPAPSPAAALLTVPSLSGRHQSSQQLRIFPERTDGAGDPRILKSGVCWGGGGPEMWKEFGCEKVTLFIKFEMRLGCGGGGSASAFFGLFFFFLASIG